MRTVLGRAWLVARQEFRMRLRTGRWRWLLAVWVVVLAVITWLLDLALRDSNVNDDRGVPMFGTLMIIVLALILVISPSLTAVSINGDRERGTLATLQVTRLTAADIALGKLLASWGVGLVALALTLPFVAIAYGEGGMTVIRVVALYGVVALLIGVVCALSQMMSALFARSITSALLSYVVVFALTLGTLLVFTLLSPIVADHVTVDTGQGYSYDNTISREDKIWWIIAPNPFVILADSAPALPPKIGINGDREYYDYNDPLSALAHTVRDLRKPPDVRQQFNAELDPAWAVWPYGLGFDLLAGAGAFIVTARRLRTPSRRLAKGVRVA
jgi:ABC-type transport system involved in multi-copper enzyme maturation permease subunit